MFAKPIKSLNGIHGPLKGPHVKNSCKLNVKNPWSKIEAANRRLVKPFCAAQLV